MSAFQENLHRIISQSLAEDIGAGDITSELTIPADATATMAFIAGEPLVACGTAVPGLLYGQLDKTIHVEIKTTEGQLLKSGDVLTIATGNARILLTGERVALNLMQRMSGVATLTKQYVDAMAGTKAKILDTRKTMPGLRTLDK